MGEACLHPGSCSLGCWAFLSLACSLTGSTAWKVLASSSPVWISTESCGAAPDAYQEAQREVVAARRFVVPQNPQKRVGQAMTGPGGGQDLEAS